MLRSEDGVVDPEESTWVIQGLLTVTDVTYLNGGVSGDNLGLSMSVSSNGTKYALGSPGVYPDSGSVGLGGVTLVDLNIMTSTGSTPVTTPVTSFPLIIRSPYLGVATYHIYFYTKRDTLTGEHTYHVVYYILGSDMMPVPAFYPDLDKTYNLFGVYTSADEHFRLL